MRSRAAPLQYIGVTTLTVGAFLVTTHYAWPDPGERALAQYRLVIAFGYGHLIGAVAFASHRLRGWVPANVPPALLWSFVLVNVAIAFTGYATAVTRHPQLVSVMLGVSMWHIVENDQTIRRSLREGRGWGPLSWRRDEQLTAIAVTFLLLAVSQSLLPVDPGAAGVWQDLAGSLFRVLAVLGGVLLVAHRRARAGLVVAGAALVLPGWLPALGWFQFADLFSAITLYHLFGWLWALQRRARAEGPAARAHLRSRLVWVHAPPMLLCAAILLVDAAWAAAVRDLLFSPGIYLFWSVLHVLQTAAVRGFEAGRSWLPARQPAG